MRTSLNLEDEGYTPHEGSPIDHNVEGDHDSDTNPILPFILLLVSMGVLSVGCTDYLWLTEARSSLTDSNTFYWKQAFLAIEMMLMGLLHPFLVSKVGLKLSLASIFLFPALGNGLMVFKGATKIHDKDISDEQQKWIYTIYCILVAPVVPFVFITVGKICSILFKGVTRSLAITVCLAAFFIPGNFLFDMFFTSSITEKPYKTTALYLPLAGACVVMMILNLFLFGVGSSSLTGSINRDMLGGVVAPLKNLSYIMRMLGFGLIIGGMVSYSWYFFKMNALYLVKVNTDDIKNPWLYNFTTLYKW